MKRKLLAMLLCTVILFNNALPVLAEMDPAEGNTTETTTTAPEVTEPITPVVCNDCGQETCVCEDETDTTAAENTSESTATSEDVTTSESTSEEPSSSAAEETDEPCADCTDEAKCEKHADVITHCETCNTIPCVCPVTATCPKCGVEYTAVEDEDHVCETTTCADCNATYITAVGHECPVVKCSTCNAVIEGEDHVCEEHICEVCQATYYGETHKCEKAVCDKCEQEYTVALGHDDCPKKCTCINTDGEHFPYCNLYDPNLALYDDLMACETIFEFDAIIDSMSEEEIYAFADAIGEEKVAELDTHMYELIEKFENGEEKIEEVEEEDTREIVYHVPTVDFTDAAPFLEPVEGEEELPFFASTFSLRNNSAVMAVADEEEEEDNGLEVDKYVDPVEGKTNEYILTLEAWATGAKTTIAQEKNVPTDIILVLDQSGSMDDDFTSTGYRTTSGTPAELYNDRNNLYVKLEGTTYSPVSVTRTTVVTGTTYTAYSGQSNSTYYSNRANLYHKCSEGVYGKVTVSRSGGIWGWGSTYSYSCANGCTLNVGSNNEGDERPSFHNALYLKEETTEYQYTFSYEKADGTTETATVKASESAPGWEFYESYASGTTTKLAALKSAVTTFAEQVANKAKGDDGILGVNPETGKSDDVDHTISVVGFARANYSTKYYNTEVFVGSTTYTYNAGSENNANNSNAAQQHYDDVPQDMSTAAGVANVTASINALDAEGGTYVDLGIEMANGILAANPVPSGQTRNRVVIVFTDGAPGYDGSWGDASYGNTNGGNATTVAKEALDEAYETKNTYGATVYTVGIFEGADATDTTLPAYNVNNSENSANRFMHLLSSNYSDSDSDSMKDSSLNGTTIPNTGYYLSASDSSALSTIFRTISQNIENGGSTTTLDAEAVVKDVITEQFVLPEGTTAKDIIVYTADYSESGFGTPVEFDDAEVTISADGRTVSVTNFNYAENWVGTETAANGNVTYRGKKLLITIPIEVRDGFWGGNQVVTNGDGSGVYEDSSANTPIEEFESPTVDVAIHVPAIEAHNQVIYYGNEAPAGDVLITHEAVPSELWKVAYVDVETPAVGSVSNTANGSYTGTMTVTPINEGTYNEVVVSATANVNILVPTATHSDITIYQGNTPEFNNCSDITWVDIESGDEITATMGEAPDVTVTYSPAADTENAFVDCTEVVPTIAIADTDYSEALDAFDVHVIIPKVTVNLTDDQHYYGAEYTKTDVTAYTTNLEWTKELNGHTEIPAPQGNPPQNYEVSLKYFTDSSKENELSSFVMPNADTPIYVKAYHGGEEIVDALFNTTCDVDDCDDHNNGYFTVHPLTCSLIIKKSGWNKIDPNESFIFTLNGDNAAFPINDLKVVVHGNGTVRVDNLPVGTYTATEDENWSWRYEVDETKSDMEVTLADSTVGEIYATNSRIEKLWLDFTTWCKNIFVVDNDKVTITTERNED